MRMIVPPGVFPPHRDSELLAARVAGWAGPGVRVLDAFTGSGVVALHAALAGSEQVVAVDLMRRAVVAATLNARLHGVRVEARRGDLFGPVAGESFDLIVANPPYVPGSDPATARGAARAWEGGVDGRALLDRFLEAAPRHLRPGGRIAVVHSSDCGIAATVEKLSTTGLVVRCVESEAGPLGPLMRRSRARSAAGAATEAEADSELIAVIEALA